MSSLPLESAAHHAGTQPGPSGLSALTALRNLRRLRQDSLGFLLEQATLGEVVAINFGVRWAYLVRSARAHQTGPPGAQHPVRAAGPGAIGRCGSRSVAAWSTSEGDFWLRQRRTMQPGRPIWWVAPSLGSSSSSRSVFFDRSGCRCGCPPPRTAAPRGDRGPGSDHLRQARRAPRRGPGSQRPPVHAHAGAGRRHRRGDDGPAAPR